MRFVLFSLSCLVVATALYNENELVNDETNIIRPRRQATWPPNTWRDVDIPYSFAKDYPEGKSKEAIMAAMKFWEENTCIRFIPNDYNAKDSIKFIYGQGCASNFGYRGGEQIIQTGQFCDTIGAVTRELARTFGMVRTHQRFDRDNYVTVNKGNIAKNFVPAFDKYNRSEAETFNLPYEFGSNMHFDEKEYAIDRSKPTLTAHPKYAMYQQMMQGRLPTFLDVLHVNMLYRCHVKCVRPLKCANGGVQDVNNCEQCKCPVGWAGSICSKRPLDTTVFDISTTSQNFTGKAGNWKLNAIATLDYVNTYFVLKAPAGMKIKLTTLWVAGSVTPNCRLGGVEVQFRKNPSTAGVVLCDPRLKREPITSEGDTMVVHIYSAYRTESAEFSAVAVRA